MAGTNIVTDIQTVQPHTLDHIIAQRQVVSSLKLAISAYWNNRADGRTTSLRPILLCSPPAGGKTTIARCIHNELANSKFVETIGESLNNFKEFCAIILNADDDTTIFCDEAQGCNAQIQHYWLTVLSERKLAIPRNGSSSKTHSIPVAKGTVFLFATTHEFTLQSALRSRLQTFRLEDYTEEGIFHILKQRVTGIKWQVESDECLQYISQRSKASPRLALGYLQTCYDVTRSDSRDVITLGDVEQAFDILQICSLGLDKLERTYLAILAESSPTKLHILAAKMGLPKRTLQEVIEPYLLKINLIDKKNADRVITDSGQRHLDQTKF